MIYFAGKLDLVTDMTYVLPMRAKQFRYTVSDIAELIKWPKWRVYKAIRLGWVNPMVFSNAYLFIESQRLTNSINEKQGLKNEVE
jgi:hypothetical protein